MLTELAEYLRDKGWRTKERGRHVVLLDPCPWCGGKGKLSFMAERGTWRCVKCDESGNVLTMRRRLGDLEETVKPLHGFYYGPQDASSAGKPTGSRPPKGLVEKCQAKLQEDPDALDYLMGQRGLTMETIQHFRLGKAEKNGVRYLVIPHVQRGQVVNVKYRTLPPAEKSFARWPGCPSVLFNGDALLELAGKPARERVVTVCEGETDAMALHQVGLPHVVSSTAGAGAWPEEWLGLLEPATTILLAYDSDEAGELGAEKAAATLGRWRCKRITPRLHDFNDMIAAGMGRQEVDQCVLKAREYGDDTIRTLSSLADEMVARLQGERPRGRPTGWLELDVILGGLRDGELTVVTGDTGSGKSTWTTALALHQLQQGAGVLIAPFEQRPWEVMSKMVSMSSGRSVYDMAQDQVEGGLQKILGLPCYLLDKHGPTPLPVIRDAIYHSRHRFGVEMVILDHLHYLLGAGVDDERKAIDAAVREIKGWTVDLGVHVLLVVHPAKLELDPRTGAVRKPSLNDLKGASSIKQEADNGIRVWRHRDPDTLEDQGLAEIAVLKCRSPAGTEGAMWAYFESGAERYTGGAQPPRPPRRRRRKAKAQEEEAPQAPAGKDAAAGEGQEDDGWMDAY